MFNRDVEVDGRLVMEKSENVAQNVKEEGKEEARKDANNGERPSPVYRVQAETLVKNKTRINAEAVNYSP